jgi:hypothetical protein
MLTEHSTEGVDWPMLMSDGFQDMHHEGHEEHEDFEIRVFRGPVTTRDKVGHWVPRSWSLRQGRAAF